MASATMNVIVNKLEKFSGNADLNTWLKNFELCVVTNKTDDLVKGQLIKLYRKHFHLLRNGNIAWKQSICANYFSV